MKCYCGTDIIEVERIKDAILSTHGFKEKIFTTYEISVAESKGDLVKYQHYAGRFAAKEAVYKALSSTNYDISFLDIEITNNKDNKNRPVVNIFQKDIRPLIDLGQIVVDVSISHIKEYATASAITTIL